MSHELHSSISEHSHKWAAHLELTHLSGQLGQPVQRVSHDGQHGCDPDSHAYEDNCLELGTFLGWRSKWASNRDPRRLRKSGY